MRRLLAILGAAVTAPAFASSDVAEALQISGHTTAGPKVITEIRSFFGVFAPIYLKCSHVDSLAADDVPPELIPRANSIEIPASLMPAPQGPVRIEMWTASGCKQSVKVFIKLWFTPDGTETFAASPVDKLPDGS